MALVRGAAARSPFARVYATLAPLLGAGAVGAALFTPPDVLSTLLLIVFQWALYTPIALAMLSVFSKLRSSRSP